MVSVIMGVYNSISTITKSIESINNQSYQDIELIICDDCSSDGTWELLLEKKKEWNISFLLRNKSNMGLAYCLNRCILLSHGDLIARMDADDWCSPERIEKQVDFLSKNADFDLVGTLCLFIDDNGKGYRFNKPLVPNMEVLPLTNPFIHPTIMIRQTALNRLKGYTVSNRTKRCEDLELWYRFFYLDMKGYNLQEYLYCKRRGKESYKRKSIKQSFDIFIVHIKGIKLLNMSWYKYILSLKPILSLLIPRSILMVYHKVIFPKEEI